jgi:hypothetical protein
VARGLIACVLKSGGDFNPDHVWWLYQQCHKVMPDWNFGVWSDIKVNSKFWHPLKKNYPKWWSKFEVYEQWHGTPILMVDLDTIFLKELKILPEHENEMLIIRDPWKDGYRHPERLAGGFMYLPEWAYERLAQVARDQGMDSLVSEFEGNDQPLLHHLFKDVALRFQDHYIDQVVSYKVHVKGIGIQPENRVVYFHGNPRPWTLKEDWIPCLSPASYSVAAA